MTPRQPDWDHISQSLGANSLPETGNMRFGQAAFDFRFPVTSFPIRRRGLRILETFSPESPLFQRCSSSGRLQDREWQDGSLRIAMS